MRLAAFQGLAEARGARPGGRRRIPFDYAFRYALTGEPGRVQRQTVTISVESAFVAVSIGYGVVPVVQPIRFGLPHPPVTTTPAMEERQVDRVLNSAVPNVRAGRFAAFRTALSAAIQARGTPGIRAVFFGELIDAVSTRLGESPGGVRPVATEAGAIGPLTAQVLAQGFRIRPEILQRVLMGDGTAALQEDDAFEAVAAPPDQIQFLYALFDDASGREFQSGPILNIAGLGISDGGRPFRHLARPIRFAPRSTVRMEITEVSRFAGDLHVSLQGYRVLGAPGSPTGPARRRSVERRRSRRGLR